MLPTRLIVSLAVATTLGLTGCHAPRPAPVIQTPLAIVAPGEAGGTAIDPDFAAGAAILDGLDVAATEDEWQIGDRVLLGVRGTKSGRTTVRFLLITLLPINDPDNPVELTANPIGRPPYKFSSAPALTHLGYYDAAGVKISEQTGRFPLGLLGAGLFDGVAPLADRPEARASKQYSTDLTDEQFDRSMRGWLTMFCFSGSLGRKGVFRDMLNDVISRPYWISYLFNQSVAINFGNDWPSRSAPWTPAGVAPIETVAAPMVCVIAGHEGARADVLACRPVAPLSLCGGVLRVFARNSEDPSTTMEVRLLAARRGKGGRDFRTFNQMMQPIIDAAANPAAPPAPGSHQTP